LIAGSDPHDTATTAASAAVVIAKRDWRDK
jgi:hypothetical protein